MMPTHFWKGVARILVNLIVRRKFRTRMFDIFMDEKKKGNEKE
ncbi:hypothetical protein C8C76_1655 [Halanaerobium saccharolyticum]|jgi:hypothetical protein|uniref:Uncharacterized protein n=1 Tax=Halanaerobium saccharolyticum TaxID=43595 RepID=A0A2T5RF26_9FIRM|nr:hypothetical protein C8C76_1655 [Halanaerobium saccharolyticum]